MKTYCIFVEGICKQFYLTEYAAIWACKELISHGIKNVCIRTGVVKFDKIKKLKFTTEDHQKNNIKQLKNK